MILFRSPSLLPSVIFLALESTSRPMIKHYAPNFLRYIQSMRKGGDRSNASHRAYIMEGYHSSTFGSTSDNLTPLFTGYPYKAPWEDELNSLFVNGCSDYRLSIPREKFYWSRYDKVGYFTIMGVTGQHYWGCWNGGTFDTYSCHDWTEPEYEFI